VRAVQTLDLVIRDAESMPPSRSPLDRARLIAGHQHAVCEAAVTLAERGDAKAIVALTHGGTTARVLSALRPGVPIFAASDRPEVTRRLALSWGAAPILSELGDDVAGTADRVAEDLIARRLLEPGSVIAFVSISTSLGPGPTNFVKLQRV
jgi:pyruvate kinase